MLTSHKLATGGVRGIFSGVLTFQLLRFFLDLFTENCQLHGLYMMPNRRKDVEDELGKIRNEATVIYFSIRSKYLLEDD
jgi:hypothetical protein